MRRMVVAAGLLFAACSSLEGIPVVGVDSERRDGFDVLVIPNATRGVIPASAVVATFAGRRLPDIAISTWGDFQGFAYRGNLTDGSVAIVLGQSSGGRRFTPGEEYYAGRGAASLAVADFNRDGRLDLAVVATFSQSGLDLRKANVQQKQAGSAGEIRILWGRGDGSFELGPVMPSPLPFPLGLAAGDMNNDGVPDLVFGTQSQTTRHIGLMLGGPQGRFEETPGLPVGGVSFRAVALGRFHDPRVLDIAALGHRQSSVTKPRLSILINDGRGSFQPRHTSLDDSSVGTVATGDLDGDGLDEVVVHTEDAIVVAKISPEGDVSILTKLPGQYALGSMRVADFDGDRKNDLLVPTSTTTYSILFGDGRGGFRSRMNLRAQFRLQASADAGATGGSGDLALAHFLATPAVADVDGDGDLDVVVPATSLEVSRTYLTTAKLPEDRPDVGGFLVIFLNKLRNRVPTSR
jgi:FG-GAP-like repeat